MGEMDKVDKMDKKHEGTKARRHENSPFEGGQGGCLKARTKLCVLCAEIKS